jgi:hypothetical protein
VVKEAAVRVAHSDIPSRSCLAIDHHGGDASIRKSLADGSEQLEVNRLSDQDENGSRPGSAGRLCSQGLQRRPGEPD